MFCNKCGNKCPDGAKFCNKCGNQLPILGTASQAVNQPVSQPVNQPVNQPVMEQSPVDQMPANQPVADQATNTEKTEPIAATPIKVEPIKVETVQIQQSVPQQTAPYVNQQMAQQTAPYVNQQTPQYNVTADLKQAPATAKKSKKKSNTGLKIVLIVLIVVLVLILAGGIAYFVLGNKDDDKDDKEDDKKTEEVKEDEDEDEDEAVEEDEEAPAAEEAAEAETTYTVDELIDQQVASLDLVSLAGLTYTHTNNGGVFECDGLADTTGVFDHQVKDLDGDGDNELITFSIAPSGADGIGGQHDISYEVYEADGDQMVLADSVYLFTGFGNGADDLANMRFMWLNDTTLCAEYRSLCCLEGDGVGVSMAIYSYDGSVLVEEGSTSISGSDWHDAGTSDPTFLNALNSLGLTRTAALMQNNNIFMFSVADPGLKASFCVRVNNSVVNESGLVTNYDSPSATSSIEMIYATEDDQDFILPTSASSYLTAGDISALSKEDLRTARNEIYARLGYAFESDDLIWHFTSKAWYTPAWTGNVVDEDLTDVEMANRDLIVQAEN